jgi:hypothetical protein
MNNIVSSTHIKRGSARRSPTSGVALIFTLLILALMIVLSLGMVIALSSQTFIGGYYRNFRGSFYAADSGVNIARVAMIDKISSLVPTTVALGSQPLPVGSDTTVQTYVNSTYNSWSSLSAGQASGSWPEQFELSSSNPATFAFANCHLSYSSVGAPPAGGPYTCSGLPPTASLCSTAAGVLTNCYAINNFQYTYAYSVDVLGQVQNSEQAEVSDNGNISITVNISQPSSVSKNVNFAAWGMFIDQSTMCDGSTLVNGTITGPVFTNGSWNFNTGSYIFTDAVGQANAQAGAQFSTSGNPCVGTATLPKTNSGQTVNPTFNNSFTAGMASVPLPGNSYNQKWAAIDGLGTGEVNAQPQDSDLAPKMKNASGTPWVAGTSSGVYLPVAASGAPLLLPSGASDPVGVGMPGTSVPGATCAPTAAGPAGCITGGGIYVKGNATVTLQASTSGGHNVQIFTIVNNGTTTTVTVDLAANTTTFKTGANPAEILTGVPSNLNANPATEAVMIYVDGTITSLAGAGSASVQDGSAVTITAASDIDVTGNLTYATKPVTTTQNQIPNTPADTLIAGNDHGQVLGLFTANGNVNLQMASGGQNLEIDASIAAVSSGGTGGLINTGQSINTLNIMGGRIQKDIYNIGATTRNVFFDRRFAQGNFSPPWFPSTTLTSIPTGVENSTLSSAVPQRVQWTCKSCQ